ncbi:hypothetical protein HN784_00480 [bacterium]|jgi:hypothetical protein|nr:hypothetical protein [bacterium]MBT4251557.1 hypothetical protein [bacterium]MBT4597606.1 hypothetical protein [bacterium]MBT6753620.1 hypothetical protein [bacterium]MBT7037757.1 hypothetical protein [bacterium]
MQKIKIITFFSLFIIFVLFLFFQKSSPSPQNLSITPEYQRTLQEMVLTIPQRLTSEKETLTLLNNSYRNLLLALPDYTHLVIFTHQANKELLFKFLKSLPIKNRVTYHFSNSTSLELWAQDYFEPAIQDNSTQLLLLPLTTKKVPSFNRMRKRNSVVKTLDNHLTVPFFFEGGNIMAAENELGHFVFIDFETIKKTRDLYKTFGKNLSISQVGNLIQGFFLDLKVVVLGDTTREGNFVHLDQSVLFLDNNTVVVYSVNDKPQSKASLQHKLYKKQLTSLGFKVKTLPISSIGIESSTSSLNAIVFKDSETQEKKVIFPVYPGQLNGEDEKKSPLLKDDLKGEALLAFDLFLELGYLPIPVFDGSTFKQKGSLHCISNVLR